MKRGRGGGVNIEVEGVKSEKNEMRRANDKDWGGGGVVGGKNEGGGGRARMLEM